MKSRDRASWRVFFARYAAIKRRLRALEASREPAARLLPAGEHWRPRTWAHFRYIVLGHLQVEGAHSLRDLAGDPPEVLGQPLSSRELRAVLESCRRHGFVARLDPGSASGALLPDDEWTVTNEGRRATRPAVPWFLGHAGRASRPIASVVAALVGILGISLTTGRGVGGVADDALRLALVLGIVFWVVVLLRHRLSGGRGGRVVAEDWARWQHERPDLMAVAFKRIPWKSLLLALATLTIGIVAVAWVPGVDEKARALMFVAIPAWLFMLPVLYWASRWNEIEASGVNRRTKVRVDRAVQEVVESEAGADAATPASVGRRLDSFP